MPFIWLDFCMKVNLNGNKDKIENLIFLKNEVVTKKERKKKKSITKIDLCIGKEACTANSASKNRNVFFF